jgi:uncharacterized protein YcbX
VATVAQLWRYPVKSMQGMAVDTVTIGPKGVDGDRMWGVVDPAGARVLSAKRWPALLLASASAAADGTVTITLPDGSTHEAGDPATDAALSAWLDHEVRVQQPPSGDGLPFENQVDAADDASDTYEWPGPAGGPFVDLAPTHLVTTASLRAGAALHPGGDWDVRRFRPTALVDAEGDTFVEDEWVGAQVRLGDEVVLSPFMPTGRCTMATRAQPGLERDLDVARTLNAHHGLNLGVYCGVERPGVVRVGDVFAVGT